MGGGIQGEKGIHLGGTARSPEDVMELRRMGLRFAEIPIVDPEQFMSSIGKYQAFIGESGLYYLCHGPREGDPNTIETLEAVYFPKLLKVLSIMPQLEMRLLTLHLWLDPRFVRPDVIAYKIRFLERILRGADDRGISVCIENLSENADHLSAVFETLPSLNLTLDLGHAQLLAERNTSFGFVEKFPERIRHIHLHDNLGGTSVKDDLHLPVGKGIIDFDAIFKRLSLIGYNRTITMELRPEEIRENLETVEHRLRDHFASVQRPCRPDTRT